LYIGVAVKIAARLDSMVFCYVVRMLNAEFPDEEEGDVEDDEWDRNKQEPQNRYYKDDKKPDR